MSPKNAVAAERRMDLASLFCMIGRHGPAVALAIIALVSVLAGFIIYRTVRGKRRKATYEAAESDSKSPAEDGDVPLVETEQERSRSAEDPRSPAESTDVSDKGSSDVKEDAGRILSDLKVRHRRTAANKKPPPYCSESISVPGNKDNTPTVHDCYEEAKAYTEEANQSLQSEEEMMKNAEDDHDSCMTARLVSSDSHKEEEKVLKDKCQGSKSVTTDKDVSDEKTNQVEGNTECVSNSLVCFEQNVHLSENRDDRPQVQETTPDNHDMESNLEHPVIPIKDVSIVCNNKDVEIEENGHHLEDIDYSDVCGSNCLSTGDETNRHQDQRDDVKDEMILPIQEGDRSNDHGGIGEVTADDEGQSNNLTAVEFNSQPLQTDKQQLQPEQQNENGHTCNQQDDVNRKMLTSSGEEHESPSVLLTSPLPCLNQLEKIDNVGDCQFGATANAKPEISGTMDFPDLSLDYQQPQSEMKEGVNVANLDIGTDLNIVVSDPSSLKEEFESEKNGTIVAKDSVECLVSSCYEEQQSNVMENIERIDSPPDAPVCDEVGFTASVISADVCDPNMSPSLQDTQSNQTHNNADFTKVTNTNQEMPVEVAESIEPQKCHIHLPSFEQTDLTWSSTGLGEESGISSMTVSPDLQDAGDDFAITPKKVVLPLMYHNPQSEEPTESQDSLFADDVAVINEDSVGVAFGSCASGFSQQPHSDNTDCVSDKSFLTNEDIFGHAIEDSYHREMDQFMEQMVDNVALTDEMKKEAGIKVDIEVVEIKEKVQMQRDTKTTVKVAGIKEKKEGTEEEEEEETEKTEISIMEATMDNNEWITDGNCQVLPWMNLSVPAFAQNHAKSEPLPSEEQQNSTSVADFPCEDVPPTTEVRQPESLATVDESTESNKRVVAVQPMPQNVNVTFRIHYLTQSPYQKVAITGNQQELGNWKDFIPLERDGDGHWSTVVSLPAESHVEWKFVVVDKGAVCRWEECGNRLLDTGYGDELLVHKWWGTL
ncbi:uncharacterized protein stbd1 [Mugil cephalus]|uniref:uncharacterized protein stbd1 n=1 Tax=Mugil cephalus TaxID=48193 RepID=UPI001FB6F14F|nr:uncharacterized protein stbd1 [Mugil cephalus]